MGKNVDVYLLELQYLVEPAPLGYCFSPSGDSRNPHPYPKFPLGPLAAPRPPTHIHTHTHTQETSYSDQTSPIGTETEGIKSW